MSGAKGIPCEKCDYEEHGLHDIIDGKWQLQCFKCNHIQEELYDPHEIDAW